MGARIPIPGRLHSHAFLTADAVDHGLSRGRLRGPDVAHPFHGVSAILLDTSSVVDRCRAYEPRLLRDQWFSHRTALELWGAPLPDSGDTRLDLAVFDPRTPPRARGVRGRTMTRGSIATSFRLGLPVVSAADAWAQSGDSLSREDLVAAGDFLVTGRRTGLHREPAMATMSELSAAAVGHRGRRGAETVAWALPRVRIGPDSRPESLLRLLIVAAHIPEPIIRLPIDVGGGLVLHPDLSFEASQVLLEYEGDGHRTSRATWLADLERHELFRDAGWRVIRVTSADLFERPQQFIARLRGILKSSR